MPEPKWFYGRGGQQTGPLSVAEMRELVTCGQISATDMVWREGMPTWIPANQAADLMPQSASAAPATVGYYTSSLGMPRCAVENLKGHAQPVGDTSDWPLDEPHMQQFEQAVKLRKKISAAAGLYRALLLLSGISLGIFIPLMIFSVGVSHGPQSMATVPLAIFSAAIGGFTVLYYFANRATRRSQAWAPLTMFIIYVLTILVQILGAVATASKAGAPGSPSDAAPQLVGGVVGIAFEIAFAVVSWRAFTAIRQYLTQPAWCQELIVKAGL